MSASGTKAMNLFIYGSGGIGCEIVDIALRINGGRKKWAAVHFVDDVRAGREHYHARVFRFEEMLQEEHSYECVVAQGEPVHRRTLYERLRKYGIKLATVIDESATISTTAEIGAGCIIGPYSFVSSNSRLDENVMLEVHTVVGHDITIKKHSVISSCCVIGGNVCIGEESFIGLNSTVKEDVRVGDHCIIGMHSGVFSNLEDGLIALGNPARIIRKNEDHSVFKR